MDFQGCLKRRLLVKTKPDSEKAQRAMKTAKARLQEAAQCMKNAIYSGAVALSYTAMFHAARALLFQEGYREKSHICVKEFIREKLVKTRKMESKYLSMLDAARLERHEILYGLETKTSRTEAAHQLKKAKAFLKEVGRLLREGMEGEPEEGPKRESKSKAGNGNEEKA